MNKFIINIGNLTRIEDDVALGMLQAHSLRMCSISSNKDLENIGNLAV